MRLRLFSSSPPAKGRPPPRAPRQKGPRRPPIRSGELPSAVEKGVRLRRPRRRHPWLRGPRRLRSGGIARASGRRPWRTDSGPRRDSTGLSRKSAHSRRLWLHGPAVTARGGLSHSSRTGPSGLVCRSAGDRLDRATGTIWTAKTLRRGPHHVVICDLLGRGGRRGQVVKPRSSDHGRSIVAAHRVWFHRRQRPPRSCSTGGGEGSSRGCPV